MSAELELFPLSLTSAVLFWLPPSDSSCITSYTITLTNITKGNVSYNPTTNATNITVTDLTQGAEYYFSVSGVDAEGRVGEESVPSKAITLDSECIWIIKADQTLHSKHKINYKINIITLYTFNILKGLSTYAKVMPYQIATGSRLIF